MATCSIVGVANFSLNKSYQEALRRRLLIVASKDEIISLAQMRGELFGFERGKKFFELSNHLGNVLVTVTDRKNGVALSSNTALVDYYLPDVASANDYYPFGPDTSGDDAGTE